MSVHIFVLFSKPSPQFYYSKYTNIQKIETMSLIISLIARPTSKVLGSSSSSLSLKRCVGSLRDIKDFKSNLKKHQEISKDKRELVKTILNCAINKREVRNYLSKYPLLKENNIYDDDNSKNFIENGFNNSVLVNSKYNNIIDELLIRYSNMSKSEVNKSNNNNNNNNTNDTDIGSKFEKDNEIKLSNTLRIAIIKIRDMKNISNDLLGSIGDTIFKMVQLGVSPIIVLDIDGELDAARRGRVAGSSSLAPFEISQATGETDERIKYETKTIQDEFSIITTEIKTTVKKIKYSPVKFTNNIIEQSNRLIQIMENKNSEIDLNLRSIRGLFENEGNEVTFTVPELLIIPLLQGIIPIVYPISIDKAKSKQVFLDSKDVITSLIKGLEKFNKDTEDKDTKQTDNNNNANDELLSIEKIIFIDEVGGIKSKERFNKSHIYINLKQECEDLKTELSDPLFIKDKTTRDLNLKNLSDMNEILGILPNGTGIITTPKISSFKLNDKNPIIYNILTDRPTISSSLPINLKKYTKSNINTTIVKSGFPLEILKPNEDNSHGFDIYEYEKLGLINLEKLKKLIDSSFQRDLNLNHYLNRINGNISTIIILGDYDGCAIVTNEKTVDNLTGEVTYVPYLDKFAVMKKLQGLPGIADIIFKSLLLNFPEEIIWRSRSNNPINKWYFERSLGNFNIPNSQWRVFYSGYKDKSLKDLENYLNICKSIEPSFDIKA